ncbi:hypothetical protein ACQUJT_04545 [Ralstonia pseudosolanacearum]
MGTGQAGAFFFVRAPPPGAACPLRRSIKESPGRRRYTGWGNAHVGRTIEQVKQAVTQMDEVKQQNRHWWSRQRPPRCHWKSRQRCCATPWRRSARPDADGLPDPNEGRGGPPFSGTLHGAMLRARGTSSQS